MYVYMYMIFSILISGGKNWQLHGGKSALRENMLG